MDQYPSKWKSSFQEVRLVTLDPATELTVDRIYIRAKQGEYDSVTFRGEVYTLGVYRKVRFWAKLNEVNNIVYGFTS